MADGITIDVKNLNLKGITALKEKIGRVIDDVLNKGARDIETMAKQLAPKNLSGLSSEISADNDLYLEKHITANVFYAPFMEFGTGKYAAEEVAKLPADWQQYAATFKGQKGGGTLDDFLANMVEWVRHKGIHGLTKSGRSKTGKKADADIYNIAYVIVVRILQNGVHPHPFMFPSYEHFRPIIIKEVETALKGL